MSTVVCALLVGLALVAVGAVRDVQAQAPPPPAITGNVYTVTYVEVWPSSRAEGLGLLQRYRAAAKAEDGNLRCEIVTRVGQPHQLVVLEVWRDQKAFEAHGKSQTATRTREQLQGIRVAPIDERVHAGLSVGPLQPGPAGDAVYGVTHVDVIPPRKDDGVAALKKLGEAARASAGNVRFEVVQQASRPNHFTVIEIWKDARAIEAHLMAGPTREFRDALGPMSGALYDERLFKMVE